MFINTVKVNWFVIFDVLFTLKIKKFPFNMVSVLLDD